MRKGIILAGGKGTRLYPLTKTLSKQLLPIYDKPMIYYPLSTLMLAKIKEYLLISTPQDIDNYKNLLGDGSKFGIKIVYKVQNKPEGLAQALILAEEFLNGSPSALILGDNIFYSNKLQENILKVSNSKKNTVFLIQVINPNEYGVAKISSKNRLIDIIEKPISPPSNWAVTGLYFYDKNAPKFAKNLKKSKRGELEITDLNKVYLKKNNLDYLKFGRGFNWFDTGSPSRLLDASNFVRIIQNRSTLIISSPEEIAFKNGWISKKHLKNLIKEYKNNDYAKTLSFLI
tara:strand:- start:21187 stop:22047 length:861 start_codon:yes stop_codon:yes gene_type:complete